MGEWKWVGGEAGGRRRGGDKMWEPPFDFGFGFGFVVGC